MKHRAGLPATLPLHAALIVCIIALAALSLAVGYAPVPPSALWTALAAPDTGPVSTIVREIRLPRVLLAVMVGASLGLSGAALQGLLRNPLAEPGLIGASSAAALGAVLVFYFGLAAVMPFALPLAGMTGALAAVILLYRLSGRDASILTLILAGVAVGSFAGALTALALNLAPSPYAALEISFWLLGSLADRSFNDVALIALPTLLGWAFLLSGGRALDALSLGEDTARSLGVDLGAVRLRLVLGVALAVGAAVSVSGVIGFVGLVVPHLLRPLLAHQPGRLLPASALGGAVLVLAADVAVRVLSPATELKLGVFTALIGAPFFLYLIVRTRRDMR